MKKFIIILATLLIFSTLSFSLSFQKPNVASEPEKIEVTQATNAHDLVCKMKLIKSHTVTAIYAKKQFKFCSESCKKQFVKNPEKYLEK